MFVCLFLSVCLSVCLSNLCSSTARSSPLGVSRTFFSFRAGQSSASQLDFVSSTISSPPSSNLVDAKIHFRLLKLSFFFFFFRKALSKDESTITGKFHNTVTFGKRFQLHKYRCDSSKEKFNFYCL